MKRIEGFIFLITLVAAMIFATLWLSSRKEAQLWQNAAKGASYYDDKDQFLIATPQTPEQLSRALAQYNNRPRR